MEHSEIKTMLEAALAVEDDHKRGWAYARAIVQLGPVEELEMARAITLDITRADVKLGEKDITDTLDEINYEISLRKKWTAELPSVDKAIAHYRRIAERTKGVGYKVALLAFSKFCSCDVIYTCKVLEEVTSECESWPKQMERRCGMYASGQWPLNHYPSVLAAMAYFTQRPCWVLRHLYLPEVTRSGWRGSGIVFECSQVDHISPEL